MRSAVQEVVAIPELLEEILSHLDWKQLFSIQRVSQQIKQCVAASTRLKRKMRILPQAQAPTDEGSPAALHPFLRGESFKVGDKKISASFVFSIAGKYFIAGRIMQCIDPTEPTAFDKTTITLLAHDSRRLMQLANIPARIQVSSGVGREEEIIEMGGNQTIGDLTDWLGKLATRPQRLYLLRGEWLTEKLWRMDQIYENAMKCHRRDLADALSSAEQLLKYNARELIVCARLHLRRRTLTREEQRVHGRVRRAL